MHQLHYFNPGHETAVFLGKANFTPSVNVRKMSEDLALLPVWYANPGDYVWIEKESNLSPASFLPAGCIPDVHPVTSAVLRERKESLPPLVATPWGLSPDSLYRMRQLKEQTRLDLDILAWNHQYTGLTGRQTAAHCLGLIRKQLPGVPLPMVPHFFSNITELESYLANASGRQIIKTPYSSSGRGLLWIEQPRLTAKEKEWAQGAIRKQGAVSIEPALNKIRDFGWEFLTDGQGHIHYAGISPFRTNEKGSFTGNEVYAQESIRKEIGEVIDPALYDRMLETVTQVLQQTYSHLYKGCIGVDIMLYTNEEDEYLLHPCVEINMRYTMGYLSLQLEKLIYPGSKGIFQVLYEKDPETCYYNHQQMQEQHPLQLIDGKINSGYLSLCPVTPETNYKAVLCVKGENF